METTVAVEVDRIRLDETRQQVQEEIAQYIKQERTRRSEKNISDDELWTHYFNNFFMSLPDSRMRAGSASAQISEAGGTMDETPDQTSASIGAGPDYSLSNLRRNLTNREFLRVVNQAVSDEGVDIREIDKLQKSSNKKDLFEYAFPVYVRLRAMRFNHRDLTA